MLNGTNLKYYPSLGPKIQQIGIILGQFKALVNFRFSNNSLPRPITIGSRSLILAF